MADAMMFLMERAKLFVEGGGAVGVAALLAERVAPARSRRDGRDPVAAATSTSACCPG